MDGLYYREARQSQADEWCAAWTEAGWRVTNAELASVRAGDERASVDPVMRYTLHATETALSRPEVPVL
jgi:hypothetical protein